MLSPEKNRLLTQVGPGTPMGELLRRYWMPIGGASEFDGNPIKAIRLMGEDLVLYKDMRGRFGLLDRHCPHRRADLAYGFVEETGIRCNYHGWLMNEAGACLEQPYDDTVNPRSRAKDRYDRAYPVKECAGLLWAYMGPQPYRSCRSGSRSPGRMASAKWSSPTFPATGFNARKTPATPCISNGCTTIGACGSPARLAPTPAST